jgi:plasmid replication initiation protein
MLLQKYANWLSYFLTSMQALLIFLPHISEYIVQVEKFLGRCQLVLEQLASEILNRVYKLFISYRVTK